MTLNEVLQTKRPYKRKGARTWFDPSFSVTLRTEDILADDWIAEPDHIPAIQFNCFWSKDHLNNRVYPMLVFSSEREDELKEQFGLIFGKNTSVTIEVIE